MRTKTNDPRIGQQVLSIRSLGRMGKFGLSLYSAAIYQAKQRADGELVWKLAATNIPTNGRASKSVMTMRLPKRACKLQPTGKFIQEVVAYAEKFNLPFRPEVKHGMGV